MIRMFSRTFCLLYTLFDFEHSLEIVQTIDLEYELLRCRSCAGRCNRKSTGNPSADIAKVFDSSDESDELDMLLPDIFIIL